MPLVCYNPFSFLFSLLLFFRNPKRPYLIYSMMNFVHRILITLTISTGINSARSAVFMCVESRRKAHVLQRTLLFAIRARGLVRIMSTHYASHRSRLFASVYARANWFGLIWLRRRERESDDCMTLKGSVWKSES